MYKNCIIRLVPLEGVKGFSARLLMSQEGSDRHLQMPLKSHFAETARKVLKEWKEEK